MRGSEIEQPKELSQDFKDVWLTKLEELTPDLINELIPLGFKRDDLEEFRKNGFGYNRKRNSIMRISPN